MKTTVKAIALTLALAALPGLAQMGIYSFGIGPFNNASNSNYATTTGYYAGGGAQGDSRTSLYGSMAGLYSAYVQRSVGIGAGAFYMASNCYDCVAIGDGAGAKWRNRTGWVQIGDAFAYTNGYLSLKAEQGAQIGPRLRLADPDQDVYAAAMHVDGGIMARSLHVETDDYGGGYVDAKDVTAQHVYGYDHIETMKLRLTGDWGASPVTLSVDSTGTNICVHAGDTLLGYLTITPPAAANQ